MRETTGEFVIELQPTAGLYPGTGRFDFRKTWTGQISGLSEGTMLSAGDPQNGTAGYVALEVFTGTIDGREGRLVLEQLGTMTSAGQVLHYLVVPGSGTGELTGVTGDIDLEVDDGQHTVCLRYHG